MSLLLVLGSIFVVLGAASPTLPLVRNVTSTGTSSRSTDSPGRSNHTGLCWNQWSDYWSASLHATETSYEYSSEAFTRTLGSTIEITYTSYVPTKTIIPSQIVSYEETTYASTLVETQYGPSFFSSGETDYETSTVVETLREGPSIIGTETFTYTRSGPGFTFVPTTTETTLVSYTSTIATNALITPPPCVLPALVPQCQTSWDGYASSLVRTTECSEYCYANISATPPCTQASLASGACDNVVSSYLYSQSWRGPHRIYTTSLGYSTTTLPDGSTSVYWPSNQTLAPSCTLGCAQCQLRGNDVQLLYWPPRPSNVSRGPVTAVGFGTTFTSPTVYISFDKLYASDSCQVVGTTYSNIIVPIPTTETISSLYGYQDYNSNIFPRPTSFNFGDLIHTPVPYSIYTSQPWCAEHLVDAGPGATCDTTKYPYAPALKIPDAVRNLDARWAACVGGLEGVYDPPRALSEASVVASPTKPHAKPTTDATPGQMPPNPGQKTTTPNAGPTKLPDSQPSNNPPSMNEPTHPPNPKPSSAPMQTLGIQVGDSTITAGGSPVTISGHTISVGSTYIVVDGTTRPIAATAEASPSESGHPTDGRPSQITVDGTTISGVSLVTVSGGSVSSATGVYPTGGSSGSGSASSTSGLGTSGSARAFGAGLDAWQSIFFVLAAYAWLI